MEPAPVYRKDGEFWLPEPQARGPFGGLHGGAVSGLLAGCMEHEARAAGAGSTLQCSTLLLRPCPLEPCSVRVATVRSGGRVTVLSATLVVGGRECALAHAICVRPQTVGAWRLEPQAHHDPAGLEVVAAPARFASTPWFRDCVEVRQAPGEFWMRLLRPLTREPTPMSRACALADWGSGLSRHDSYEAPLVGGFPNADLAIHLAREPQGEWLGLRARSVWHAHGTGMTDTQLLDVHGPVGRACHTLVLLPLQGDRASPGRAP